MMPIEQAKMTLVNYNAEVIDSTAMYDVRHSVRSASARVEIAKIVASQPEDEQVSITMEAIAKEENVDLRDNVATIRALVKDGRLTIQQILKTAQLSPELAEQQTKMLFAIFRVACNRRGVPSEWMTRIDSDDFLNTQDVEEMEGFVNSFRRQLGV